MCTDNLPYKILILMVGYLVPNAFSGGSVVLGFGQSEVCSACTYGVIAYSESGNY